MNLIRTTPHVLDPDYERVSDPILIRERFSQYLTDESQLQGDIPLSITFPRSIDQLAAILADHHGKKEPTTFSAARSGVVSAAVPVGRTHLISLERLVGISSFAVDEQSGEPYISILAGTPLSAIDDYLNADHPQYYYPVDPTYRHSTIGGNISTNASGARTYHYGSTRNWVRGLTVILSSGEMIRFRRGEIQGDNGRFELITAAGTRRLDAAPVRIPNTKNSVGYHYTGEVDLIDIFVAAEGTLGVIAEAEIRLAPRPEHRLYFLQFFEDTAAAFKFAAEVQTPALKLLAVEFVDKRSLQIAATHPLRGSSRALQALRPEFSAAVFLDLELGNGDDLDSAYQIIAGLLENAGADVDDSIAGTEDRDLADIKFFRHAIPEMINRLVAQRKISIPRLHKISTDMAVPAAALRELFDYYQLILSGLGLDYFIFGHFGNGHLHVNVVPKTEEELDNFIKVYLDFGREVIRLGGAVAGEHGIGRIKKEFLQLQYAADELETLRRIKTFFDPDWLLNPGVLIDRR